MTVGALTILSGLVLTSCAPPNPVDPSGTYYGVDNSASGGHDSGVEDDSVDDPDAVTADCVSRASADDGSYKVVSASHCPPKAGGGHGHSAYFWYYGGRRRNGRVSRGTTVMPKDTEIVTRSGRSITRGGLGGRDHGGS
ncbi:hypothetical protein DQ384_31820 [Sphaerisporangium album]|uniref:Uncharacterized protein n=1 Tax=Sphaerisporangium album TaxID=509200 RepID=A0A367F681_9ACTN|nr:hypothetical protein [Sphaerisporangium album]RCG25449.1 hypothetical protein DQ384_31820 [Sphaerisporangium album]